MQTNVLKLKTNEFHLIYKSDLNHSSIEPPISRISTSHPLKTNHLKISPKSAVFILFVFLDVSCSCQFDV